MVSHKNLVLIVKSEHLGFCIVCCYTLYMKEETTRVNTKDEYSYYCFMKLPVIQIIFQLLPRFLDL